MTKFDKFLNDIIIPQTTLYSHQNGKIFSTDLEEVRAYFEMNLVMGYHILPCIRDYWSSNPNLCVPFVVNVMPKKGFEEIRTTLHFDDNMQMGPQSDPFRDMPFKVGL